MIYSRHRRPGARGSVPRSSTRETRSYLDGARVLAHARTEPGLRPIPESEVTRPIRKLPLPKPNPPARDESAPVECWDSDETTDVEINAEALAYAAHRHDRSTDRS